MKYVYYGNYAEYLEVARVELFRKIGISYNEIEQRGIWLPVSEYSIKYLKPAKYDDPVVVIGASESYEARCRHCHEIER